MIKNNTLALSSDRRQKVSGVLRELMINLQAIKAPIGAALFGACKVKYKKVRKYVLRALHTLSRLLCSVLGVGKWKKGSFCPFSSERGSILLVHWSKTDGGSVLAG